jgi:transcriptional regulator with XRE-family HTH domain
MSSDADIAVAVDGRGRRTPLGEFVFGLLTDSEQSVSEVARRANLSRSFLYLLKDDRQVPSLDTLIALFEAIGVDEVRVGEVGERGDLAVRVNDREWWVRLPQDNKRAARSRSALQSLTTGGSFDALPGGMAAMASTPPAGASSYDRDTSFTRRSAGDERKQQLAELLAAAGGLDRERLELLLEHARLLGRST